MTYAATSPSSAAAVSPPVALQRAAGEARLAFKSVQGATRLARLYELGSAKARLPRTPADAPAEAVLINTAGGLTGGDRLSYAVDLGPGCRARVTTQSCERIYRALDGPAEVSADIVLAAGAELEWLPQETILFNGGALRRRLTAAIAEDSRLLIVEPVIFGRAAMGETVVSGSLRDRWRISRGGALVFAEDLALTGPIADLLNHRAVLDGGAAMATVALVAADAEHALDAVLRAVGEAGSASAWDGKLVARLVAADGQAMRAALIPVMQALTRGGTLPRIWQS